MLTLTSNEQARALIHNGVLAVKIEINSVLDFRTVDKVLINDSAFVKREVNKNVI